MKLVNLTGKIVLDDSNNAYSIINNTIAVIELVHNTENKIVPIGSWYIDDCLFVRRSFTDSQEYWEPRGTYSIITHSNHPFGCKCTNIPEKERCLTNQEFRDSCFVGVQKISISLYMQILSEHIGRISADRLSSMGAAGLSKKETNLLSRGFELGYLSCLKDYLSPSEWIEFEVIIKDGVIKLK